MCVIICLLIWQAHIVSVYSSMPRCLQWTLEDYDKFLLFRPSLSPVVVWTGSLSSLYFCNFHSQAFQHYLSPSLPPLSLPHATDSRGAGWGPPVSEGETVFTLCSGPPSLHSVYNSSQWEHLESVHFSGLFLYTHRCVYTKVCSFVLYVRMLLFLLGCFWVYSSH